MMNTEISSSRQLRPKSTGGEKKLWLHIRKNYELYIFLIPTILYFIIFHYIPMSGIQLAFKKYHPLKGIWGSPFIGAKHFIDFFNSYQFGAVIKNTFTISFYQLGASFPIPIILALMINQLNSKRFKKIVQTVTYAPHFISVVVLVGMMYVFLSPSSGIVNSIIRLLGGEPIFFFGRPELFSHLYVWSGIWQNTGWGTIIYIAALTAISPDQHEAAIVDGATKLQRILYIDIPGIMPTAIIILILNTGRIMNIGFEKAFLMQNSLNSATGEIIATYVYKAGLINARYEYATAVGLFNSVINLILILSVNKIAKMLKQSSLW